MRVYAAIFVFIFGENLLAQTNTYSHQLLSKAHSEIRAHSAIIGKAALTKEECIEHVRQIMRQLDQAKQAYVTLVDALSEKQLELAKIHTTAIETYHVSIAENADQMVQELKKERPDAAKLQEKANVITNSVNHAEIDHQKLKDKTN